MFPFFKAKALIRADSAVVYLHHVACI